MNDSIVSISRRTTPTAQGSSALRAEEISFGRVPGACSQGLAAPLATIARPAGRNAAWSAMLIGLAVLGFAGGAMAQDRTTIVVGKMVMPDGTLAEKMGVVIVGGKI